MRCHGFPHLSFIMLPGFVLVLKVSLLTNIDFPLIVVNLSRFNRSYRFSVKLHVCIMGGD